MNENQRERERERERVKTLTSIATANSASASLRAAFFGATTRATLKTKKKMDSVKRFC